MPNDRMDSRDLAIGIVLSLQSAIGILGNATYLLYYLLIYYNDHTLKTIDLILTQIFTANSLIILSKGIPQIMRAFGWKHFFNEFGCQLILYALRLGRSMSISTTCLLSVFQAIAISPSDFYCKDLKIKVKKYVHLSISLFWILYMVVNMGFPIYTSTKRNSKNKTQKRDFEFCPSQGRDKIVDSLYIAFWVFPEVLFSIVIVCSSISMIVILYGHKKRVQHILSTHASPRISPESRATQTILVLVCTFLTFYTLSSILQGYIAISHNPNWWLMNITVIISMSFPTLSPFRHNYCHNLKEKMPNDRMDSKNLAIGIVLSLQSAIGLLGNASFLLYYLLIYYNDHTLKTLDLILTHIFTANSLIILSKGVPQIMRAFGWKHFFNDFGCQLILYALRLGRSMSISTTCLLSVFQAITISPSDFYCKDLKIKVSKYVRLSISLFWILYMVVNVGFPIYTSTKRNSKNNTQKRDFEFCPSQGRDKIVDSLYTAFWIFPEVLFSMVIVCSSISMIVILYGHKKRVQHILSTHASPRISPESRATQTILVLVCTFLTFYTLSSILQGYIAISHNPNWWLMNITAIISMSFPTLSPFVMRHDSIISRFSFF
ncbi:hypothetical protein A6R68_01777 [Neotoma lepida]|uniref:G-protein coupled receptors family 1 profile domain-containing protein n=1 Tax=Neotoma lepida TaxID=56216 RepID=A0A1A6GWF7_NEOLE|nr:hypothetical protein A6R68_01777 [Neotoma lepida]